uniref:Putative mrg-binding protein n=1 Tax=Schistosoma mansoni TaxID=6183 RepID=A0AA82MMS8_SCHMA
MLLHTFRCFGIKQYSPMVDQAGLDVWNLESEIQLFHAILNHKPVGADRHFQMIYVCNLVNSFVSDPISTDDIWKKLGSLYNMEELHDSEVNPFQSKMKEFSLPEEYDSLKSLKYPRVTSNSGISVSRSPRTDSCSQKRTRKSLRSVDSNTTLASSTNSPVTTTVSSVTSREKRR